MAIVADGNRNDSDDIVGTPVSLAMLRIFDKSKQLVHYTHSCDLNKSQSGREKQMEESLFGTASRWGGFDTKTFFNAKQELSKAVSHLKDQINKSSSSSLLWIIEAGEPDVIYMAMRDAQKDKRQYVRIVTHHPHNDRGKDFDLKDIENISGTSSKMVVRISDQNRNLKKPLREFHWMRDHKDSRVQWLWERGALAERIGPSYIKGTYDPSDAGMVWYVLTGATNGGNQKGSGSDLRKKIDEWLKNEGGTPTPVPPTPPAVSLAFAAPTTSSFTAGDDIPVEVSASNSGAVKNMRLYVNGRFVRQENKTPYQWNTKGQNDGILRDVKAGTYELKVVVQLSNNETKEITKSIEVTSKSTPAPQSQSVTITDSDACGSQSGYDAKNAYDGNENSRWANTNSLSTACVTYEFQPHTITAVRIKLYKGNSRNYPLEIKVGSETVFRGTTSTTTGYWNVPLSSNISGSELSVRMTDKNSNGTSWLSIQEIQLEGVATGAKDISSAGTVSISTNPVQDEFEFTYGSELPAYAELYVYSITGKRIKTVSLSNSRENIDVSALPIGVYIVRTNLNTDPIKIIKE